MSNELMSKYLLLFFSELAREESLGRKKSLPEHNCKGTHYVS